MVLVCISSAQSKSLMLNFYYPLCFQNRLTKCPNNFKVHYNRNPKITKRFLPRIQITASPQCSFLVKRNCVDAERWTNQPALRAVSLSFLPTEIVRALPFRVRAFVFVRCPRTGSCLRWRSPR